MAEEIDLSPAEEAALDRAWARVGPLLAPGPGARFADEVRGPLDLSGLGDLLNLSRQEVLDALFDAAIDSFDLALPDAAFYSPDQPRLPAGQAGGGEWTSGGGGAAAEALPVTPGADVDEKTAAAVKSLAAIAARKIAAAGFTLPPGMAVRLVPGQAEPSLKGTPDAYATFDGYDVVLRSGAPWSDAARGFAGLEGGWVANDKKYGVIVHEVGHALHAQRRVAGDYREKESEQENWYSRRPAAEATAGKVSGYAKENPREFVAEVFSGLVAGKSYDQDVTTLYASLGGPPSAKDAPFYSPDQPRVPAGRPGGGRWAGGVSPGTAAARDAAGDAVRAFAAGQGTATQAEAEALAGHLARLTVAQIHALKAEHGLKGSAPNKAALVQKMAQRFAAWRAGRAPKEAVPSWPADYDVFGKRDVFADESVDAGTLTSTPAAPPALPPAPVAEPVPQAVADHAAAGTALLAKLEGHLDAIRSGTAAGTDVMAAALADVEAAFAGARKPADAVAVAKAFGIPAPGTSRDSAITAVREHVKGRLQFLLRTKLTGTAETARRLGEKFAQGDRPDLVAKAAPPPPAPPPAPAAPAARELTAKAASPEFYAAAHKYSGVRAAMARRFAESGREARGEPSVTKLSARHSGPPDPGTVLWKADGPHLVVSSEVRDLPNGPTQRFVTVPVVPTDADRGVEAEYLRHAVSSRVAGPGDDRDRPAFEAETARMLARLRRLEGGV